MSQILRVFVLAIICVFVAGEDLTRVSKESGRSVVEAVIDSLQTSCVFGDDKLLLRRMAYVLTEDGEDPRTYRAGYSGGVWQVNEDRYSQTKTSNVVSRLRTKIGSKFGIDWSKTTWSDLEKPLYSAIAARLYLEISRGNKEIPRSILQQETFLQKYYNVSGIEYVGLNNTLRNLDRSCASIGIDLVFVLDGSGSVTKPNFIKMKEFVQQVVYAFDIGENKTRVGVMQYSNLFWKEFYLNTTFDKQGVLNRIGSIKYRTGGTYTDEALDIMTNDMFSEKNGARPEDGGRPRIGIVVTDGKSRDSRKTAAAARRAIDAGIVLFAVGVGAGVDIPELNSIGSTPVCTHVFPLTDFEEMAPFVKEIETKSCQEPAPVKTGTVVTGVLLANQKQFFSLQANRSSGFTVKVSMSVGTTSLYASTKVKNPSPASFEHKVTASTTQTAQLYLSPSQLSVGLSASGTAQSRVVRQASADNEQVQVYLTLEAGSGSQNEFKMESGHGDVRSSATNVSSMAGCLVFSLLAFLLSSFLKDL